MEIKKLNCLSCGASLQIPEDLDFLNCSSCGEFFQVLRGEGYWALKTVKGKITQSENEPEKKHPGISEGEQTAQQEIRRVQLNEEYSTLNLKIDAIRSEIRALSQIKRNDAMDQNLSDLHWQEFNILDRLRILRASIFELDSPDLTENTSFMREQISILDQEIAIITGAFDQTVEIIHLGENLQNERIKWVSLLSSKSKSAEIDETKNKTFNQRDSRPGLFANEVSNPQLFSKENSPQHRIPILALSLGLIGILALVGFIILLGKPQTILKPVEGIGSTQTSPKDGMVMVYVPAGKFQMGFSEDQYKTSVTTCADYLISAVQTYSETEIQELDMEKGCETLLAFNKPAHSVDLDAFWIDRTEVTNSMYAKCVNSGSCTAPMEDLLNIENSYFGNVKYDEYPVIDVDWNQANAYCQWAGRRLPTEAEWEKAALGTTDQSYPWGDGLDCQKANFGDCRNGITEVGSYPAGSSVYGTLDMVGNVGEWVADYFDANYYQVSPEKNPSGPSTGDGRVTRGQSYASDFSNADVKFDMPDFYLNPKFRLAFSPEAKAQTLGFRCAK